MYERFTDKARSVMQYANREAQLFNQEYIGAEHILLGILRHEDNAGAEALRSLGLNLEKIHAAVREIVVAGPDMITMGKLPLTPRARSAIDSAIAEAGELNHLNVGPEHLLLGLIREREGVVAEVLKRFQVTWETVREAVLQLILRVEKLTTSVAAGPQVTDYAAIFLLKLPPAAVNAIQEIQKISGRKSLDETLTALISVCLPPAARVQCTRVMPSEESR